MPFQQRPQMHPDPTETPYATLPPTMGDRGAAGFVPQPLPDLPDPNLAYNGRRAGEGALLATALGALFGGAQGGAAAGQGYLQGAQRQQGMQADQAMQQWRARAAQVQNDNEMGYRAASDQRDQTRWNEQKAMREKEIAAGQEEARAAAAQRLKEFDWKVRQEAQDRVDREVRDAMERGDREYARNLDARKEVVTQLLTLRKAYFEDATGPIDPKNPPARRKAAAEAVQGIDKQLQQYGFNAQLPTPGEGVLNSPQIDPLEAKKLAEAAAEREAKAGERARAEARQRARDARADSNADRNYGLAVERLNRSGSGGPKTPPPMTEGAAGNLEARLRGDKSKLSQEALAIRTDINGRRLAAASLRRKGKEDEARQLESMNKDAQTRLDTIQGEVKQKDAQLRRLNAARPKTAPGLPALPGGRR
jgi:hypothetical protein